MPAAHAQEPGRVYRIAIVHPSASPADMSETERNHPYYPVFFQELRRLGFVEGQNLVVGRYSGEGRPERYAEVARSAVAFKPDAIVANTNRMVKDLKQATTTVPIVGMTADPVGDGLVASLARPGGNITGVSIEVSDQIEGKCLEILKEAVPRTSRVGYLAPRDSWATVPNETRRAAQQLGITLIGPPLDSPIQDTEYRRVIAAMARQHADALLVTADPENLTHRRLIVELAEKVRLPAIYPWRDYVQIGGLMAYAIDLKDAWRRVAGQVAQILNGAHPAEMPYFQPTEVRLIINLKTARALGIEIPSSLLTWADEVIE
jgi:putative ABC transport system substrate-binding protein